MNNMSVFYGAFVVLTNLFYPWAALEALMQGDLFVCITFLLTFVTSSFYHIIKLVFEKTDDIAIKSRLADNIFANNAIVFTILSAFGITLSVYAVSKITKYNFRWFISAALILFWVTVISVIYGNYSVWAVMAIVLSTVVVVIARLIFYRIVEKYKEQEPKSYFDKIYFYPPLVLASALFVALAIMCFLLDEDKDSPTDNILHGNWHSLGSLAPICIQKSIRYGRRLANQQIKK